MRAIWTLAPLSVTLGIVAAVVFRNFSDREAIRRTVNRMIAHVLEFRLFLDSPALVFRAQRELLRENLKLLRLIALPCAILAIPFALAITQLDGWYGRAPLPVGEDAIVTVQLTGPAMIPLQLETPAGISVETPAIRILHDRRVAWLIRPTRDLAGQLTFTPGNYKANIVAGNHSSLLSLHHKFRNSQMAWVEIPYPQADILGLNWLIWFFVILGISATVVLAL